MSTEALAALVVVTPLLVAAALVGFSFALPRWTANLLALLTAALVTAGAVVLLHRAATGGAVTWFGGWRPRGGLAIGISFVIDPAGAGLALLTGVLATAGLLFSWRLYPEVEGHRYPVLVLVFVAAMVGFSLSGDLFNLFVFFELMGVAAYALTGTRIEEPGPLQGAINFAVINSLGSFLLLTGVGLLYGRTGALNLAQLGTEMATRSPDGLVVVAFTTIAAGFLVKGAAVPFHFWLADAHAVAPTPVCVLFSGVMVELGLYGLARVYWTVFEGVMGPAGPHLGGVLMAVGALTAVVGAVMSMAQQHLKRLLAFSTVSHVGLMLIGLGIMDRVALAGVAVYVTGHAMTKGALFLAVGILIHRLGSVDEERLRGGAVGRGADLAVTGVLFALGGLALAGLPPFGLGLGKTLIDDAAVHLGDWWVPWLAAVVGALTGGAVLRVAGRVFLGWGPAEHARFASERWGEREEREAEVQTDRTPASMMLPVVLLTAGALVVGLLPGLWRPVERWAGSFEGGDAYASLVLDERPLSASALPLESPSEAGPLVGGASAAAAVAVAVVSLFRRRVIPRPVRARVAVTAGRGLVALRQLHSGHVGDDAAWFLMGVAALGGLMAVAVL
jgi:multicomponent Na+:H+ antiporter subunit D